MFSFFLLPASMAIGGALVSVPIIIHLINRMRFKRIRWAAMEFLLKSQKRNRRRLIIEQILLLLLRCLLVLLAAFLVSRFIGCSATGAWAKAQTTAHCLVLDDSLSTTDHVKDQGAVRTAFDDAKQLVREIARKASLAGATQQFRVLRLSDPANPVFDARLNDETLAQLNKALDDLQPTELHLQPQQGIRAAGEYFGDKTLGQRILHFVGDFRSRDWSGPEAEGLHQDLDALCQAGVQVNLVDTADPIRSERGQAPAHHDNVGIVDLRSDTRVAALGMPVQFTVTIQNFTNQDRDNAFLTVKVNGAERLESSQPIPKLEANKVTPFTFQTTFVQKGFNQITASLEDEAVGVSGDNKRYAVVEVQDQVPVLILDGAGSAGLKPPGDTFYLQTVLNSARGYQVVPRGLDELDKGGLDQYPCIYLLNVPEIKSDRALKNLEDYVKNGGKVAFFLGDKVRPSYYNEVLYNKGKGLFPVPLADRYVYERLAEDKMFQKLYLEEQQKIFLRSKDHPIFRDVYPLQFYFRFLLIEGYWPTQPRGKWESVGVEELVTLPNEKPLENFRGAGNQLNNRLPVTEEKYAKYRPALERHQRAVRDALGGNQLWELATALQDLLEDRGDPDKKNPDRPNLKDEFWNLSETQGLRNELDQFRQLVQYGDPLVVTGRYGKGRTVVFLTTAGKSWNYWPGGCPASATYPAVIHELQRYLTSGAEETNRFVGAPLTIELDATQYEPRMRAFFQPEVAEAPKAGDPPGGKRGGLTDLGEVLGTTEQTRVTLAFDRTGQPGVYLFDLYPRPQAGGGEPKAEQRAYVFNVDTTAEGELRRATRDDLERNPPNAPRERGKITLYTPKSADYLTSLTQHQSDASESPWLFLVMLLVLVAEQALAVHLSFHLKGAEAQLPAAATVRPAVPGAAA